MARIKKISIILSNLLLYGLVALHYNGILYPSKLQIADSINIQSDNFSETNDNKINYQKPESIFYKTDSIYSFHSPKGYFSTLLYNMGEQATAPLHFNTMDWLKTGVALGITAALISVDNDIDDWARVQKQNHVWVANSSPVITKLGGNYGIYSVAAMGLVSAAFNDKKGVNTCLLASQAMITSGVWVRLIKLIAGRERPMADYQFSKSEGGKWYGPLSQLDQDESPKKTVSSFDSFPSGHTATAFSIATVFASQYRDIKAVPITCYSVATLVGISRLTEHEHWASDVFIGGLIGYLCGRQVVSHYNRIRQNPYTPLSANPKSNAQFSFVQKGNQVGLALKW